MKQYDFRKENGLCVRCGKPQDHDSVYCYQCTEDQRIARKRDYHNYLDHGICPVCRKNKIYVGKRCEICAAKHTEYQIKWRENHKKNTDKYKDDKIVKQKEKRAYRKEHNLCTLCGKVPPTEGYVTCANCRLKKNEQTRKYRLIAVEKPHWKTVLKEQGVCVICGKPRYKNFGLCQEHYEKQAEAARNSSVHWRKKREQTIQGTMQGL